MYISLALSYIFCIMTAMNVVTFIRTKVFGCETQSAFADALGTTQASVSRWEAKGHIPGPMQPVIRSKAMARGEWCDSWFFEAPDEAFHAERPQ